MEVKSQSRIDSFGEVFTPDNVVKDMLDIPGLKEYTYDIGKTFFEPSCGTGNFLIEVARRKVEAALKSEKERKYAALKISTSLYGIDIQYDNVNECIRRLASEISRLLLEDENDVLDAVKHILKKNIICGDCLTGTAYRRRIDTKKQMMLYKWKVNTDLTVSAAVIEFNNIVKDENIIYDQLHGEIEAVFYDRLAHAKKKEYTIEERVGKKAGFRIDAIIGNPPYNKTVSRSTITGMTPLYDAFTLRCLTFAPRYMTFIIPARFWSGGKQVLDKFREEMLKEKRLDKLYIYDNSLEIWKDIEVPGGLCYMLFDSEKTSSEVEVHNMDGIGKGSVSKRDLGLYTYTDQHGKMQHMVVTDNMAESIVRKVTQQNTYGTLTGDIIMSFGLRTDFRGTKEEDLTDKTGKIKVVCSYGRIEYADISEVTQINIDKWKVFTGCLNSDRGGIGSREYRIFTQPYIAEPNEVCSRTYICTGCFDTKEEAENMAALMKTKFMRFLVYATMSGIHLSQKSFCFCPKLDLAKEWTDFELYKKFNLTVEEIRYIEAKIAGWTDFNGEFKGEWKNGGYVRFDEQDIDEDG